MKERFEEVSQAAPGGMRYVEKGEAEVYDARHPSWEQNAHPMWVILAMDCMRVSLGLHPHFKREQVKKWFLQQYEALS